MSKGDLAKLVYTEDQLRNVDFAIPQGIFNDFNDYFNIKKDLRRSTSQTIFPSGVLRQTTFPLPLMI